ncbi:MAG: ParB/RepB/Spo0J family partition protein [Clostridia bacterium]|nr:ParB/RepB/Spo0J family partition protein [Clostridia bacterium]
MAKKGGLGKGLDALFFDNSVEEQGSAGAVKLKLFDIEPNKNQPRKHFDEEALSELASSIAEHGILQPIVVRPIAETGYQIVAGERRWRAARLAGLTEVPVVIKELSDTQVMELALIENLQREDLNPIEEAEGYKALMETYGLTQDTVAKRVGKSRSAIANSLRLLNLPESVREMARDGRISAGHARTLLAFDDVEVAKQVAQEIVEKGLSVRDVERMAQKKPAAEKPAKIKRRDSFYDEVELALSSELGRKIKVNKGRGKGTIEIEFYGKDDLKELANLICKNL